MRKIDILILAKIGAVNFKKIKFITPKTLISITIIAKYLT